MLCSNPSVAATLPGALLATLLLACNGRPVVASTGTTEGSGDGSGEASGAGSGEGHADEGSEDATPSDEHDLTPTDDLDSARCEQLECDVGRQDCPDPDDKCTAWRCGDGCCTNSTRCTPITGDRQAGESCVRDAERQRDDCAPGLFCMPDDGSSGQGGPGHCISHCAYEACSGINCETDEDEPGHCFDFNLGSLPLCLSTCDPLEHDCPDPSHVCLFTHDHFFCGQPALDDWPQHTGPGDPCHFESQCNASICAPADLRADCVAEGCHPGIQCGCCAVPCDLEAERPDEACDTDAGERCVPLLDCSPDDIEHVGVCVIPADDATRVGARADCPSAPERGALDHSGPRAWR